MRLNIQSRWLEKIRPFGKNLNSQWEDAVPHRMQGAPFSDWSVPLIVFTALSLQVTSDESDEKNNQLCLYAP